MLFFLYNSFFEWDIRFGFMLHNKSNVLVLYTVRELFS